MKSFMNRASQSVESLELRVDEVGSKVGASSSSWTVRCLGCAGKCLGRGGTRGVGGHSSQRRERIEGFRLFYVVLCCLSGLEIPKLGSMDLNPRNSIAGESETKHLQTTRLSAASGHHQHGRGLCELLLRLKALKKRLGGVFDNSDVRCLELSRLYNASKFLGLGPVAEAVLRGLEHIYSVPPPLRVLLWHQQSTA